MQNHLTPPGPRVRSQTDHPAPFPARANRADHPAQLPVRDCSGPGGTTGYRRRSRRSKTTGMVTGLTAVSVLVLAGCAGGVAAPSSGEGSPSASASQSKHEVASLSPRAVIAYDGGVVTVDTNSGEVVDDTPHDGFLRLNPAGDGRHVLVTDGDAFRVFDSGLHAAPHGDHFHYYESTPGFTGATFDAPHAGHVVVHGEKTTLFSDGDGSAQTFAHAELGETSPGDAAHGPGHAPAASGDDDAAHGPDHGPTASGNPSSTHADATHADAAHAPDHAPTASGDAASGRPAPTVTRHRGEHPHHGVALELSDGSLLTTRGTEDERNTVQVLDRHGKVLAETNDCPGVHGETVAKPGASTDTVVLGCENGPVIYRDGAFHKSPANVPYARSGTLKGSEDSPFVLADRKTDPDAEHERPTEVTLIDARDGSQRVTDLGSSYWFRSLARGPGGEALVLTYDGALRVLDPATGTQSASIPVVQKWREKEDWQQPGPAVTVAGDHAYVTDAEHRKLHVVDVAAGKVIRSIDVPHTPVELAVVTGAK